MENLMVRKNCASQIIPSSYTVYYLSNISNAIFRMKSLVYLENTSLKYNKLMLTNSIFGNNQEIFIYAIHHIIYLQSWGNLVTCNLSYVIFITFQVKSNITKLLFS